MNRPIAIQGIRGSNHHRVVREYYGPGAPLLECMSFESLVKSIIEEDAGQGVMAIENSIAGSILPNYNLLAHHGLHIVGEHYLNIHHYLMVLGEQSLNDIREVHSHPMALLQCMQFLQEVEGLKLVEDRDTAETARRIQENELKGVAAIAPEMAADLYGLRVIAREIETIKNNATRFIIVQKENHELPPEKIDKASLRFVTDHKRGSLATVLNVMSDCNLNLTKIQSLPIVETPWKYAFFVDVTFNVYADFQRAKALLELMLEEFRVLGEYKNAKK